MGDINKYCCNLYHIAIVTIHTLLNLLFCIFLFDLSHGAHLNTLQGE